MKNLLSTALFGVIFLGLAALAFLSAPRGASEVAASTAPETTSAVVAGSAQNALLATNKFNFISLPLDASSAITPYTAQGLADYQGGVVQVLKWNATSQAYDSYFPGIDPPIPPFNFALELASPYFLEVDATTDNIFTVVGDVPPEGSVSFTMQIPVSGCTYNTLSLPLDESAITNAQGLADDIGGVSEVLTWDAGSQAFTSYFPGIDPPIPPFNFNVQIGYPYFVCLNNAGPVSWP